MKKHFKAGRLPKVILLPFQSQIASIESGCDFGQSASTQRKGLASGACDCGMLSSTPKTATPEKDATPPSPQAAAAIVAEMVPGRVKSTHTSSVFTAGLKVNNARVTAQEP